MHSYAIPGPARRFVYIGTVALSAAVSIAAGAATPDHRGLVAGAAFTVAYVLIYALAYHVLWRLPPISRRLGIVDWSGSWSVTLQGQAASVLGGTLRIRQNLVTIEILLEEDGRSWRSVSAGFARHPDGDPLVSALVQDGRLRFLTLIRAGSRLRGEFRDGAPQWGHGEIDGGRAST